MTTTMEFLDNSPQMHPQQQAQAQANPTSESAVVPENPPPLPDSAAILAKKQRQQELLKLSKTFGPIPNVPIFSGWKSRRDCCDAAVHRSNIAGICGNKTDGAFSVALSSLYADNEDGGDVIIYTGAGGRKRYTDTIPPKRLKMGPQTEDQTWDHPQNKALIVSFLTGNPVRAIRSWRCPSQYAPIEGYRYDGLYRVTAYWTAKGRNGKKICRCRLERLPNQPPIPLRPTVISTRKPRGRQCLPRHLSCSPFPSAYSCDTPGDTDFNTAPNHCNSSATQLAVNTQEGPSGVSTPLPEQAVPETSCGNDLIMGEVDVDVEATQPPSPQHGVSSKPSHTQRYRWNPRTNEIIMLPTPDSIPATVDPQEEDEEGRRCEDDTTLVPSEDGHLDTAANSERMETEYVSDRGTSPMLPTPEQPRPSV